MGVIMVVYAALSLTATEAEAKIMYGCMYVCMATNIIARVWINRVRLPILHVSAEQGKMIFP